MAASFRFWTLNKPTILNRVVATQIFLEFPPRSLGFHDNNLTTFAYFSKNCWCFFTTLRNERWAAFVACDHLMIGHSYSRRVVHSPATCFFRAKKQQQTVEVELREVVLNAGIHPDAAKKWRLFGHITLVRC